MGRRRRRRRRPTYHLSKKWIKKIKHLFILAVIMWGLRGIYRNLYTNIMDYATMQTVNVATLVIQEGMAQSDLMTYDIEELIIFKEDEQGLVNEMLINTPILNRLLVSTTAKVEENLLKIETGKLNHLNAKAYEDGIIFYVPWSAAFNLTFFHDIGPKFPVSARVVGNATSDLTRDIKPYGINNAMLEIALNVRVRMYVALPFRSEEIEVEVSSPLVIKMITGDIPQYYFIGNGEIWPGTTIIGP